MGKKKLYLVEDLASGKQWAVIARSFKQAEEKVMDNIDWGVAEAINTNNVEVEKSVNGVIEISTKAEVL